MNILVIGIIVVVGLLTAVVLLAIYNTPQEPESIQEPMASTQKTWVEMAPTQCDNPWENDLNDWYKSHNNTLTQADRLEVIKNYYKKLGITIFDLKIIEYEHKGIVTCGACFCGTFSILYVSVSTSDLQQMLDLGFKISETTSP